MRWQIRLAVDKVKGVLPAREFLRQTKRRICGFSPSAERDRGAIEEGLAQLEWAASAIDLRAARIVEIGSGWQPIIPLLYSLAGAREVVMTDLNRLCHAETFAVTLQTLLLNREMIGARLRLPDSAFERLAPPPAGEPLEKSLERFAIRYLAPCDFRKAGLAPNSVDAVVSRAVLEHIPPEVLRGIFAESARILRPGGIICHFVDNSDHFEHGDKHILRINFLRYSDRAFRWIQSSALYQNRLRHSQYREMLCGAGFRLEREERVVDKTSLLALKSFPLAGKFRAFSEEDLATVDSYFLGTKG